jgi:hypothetical protein
LAVNEKYCLINCHQLELVDQCSKEQSALAKDRKISILLTALAKAIRKKFYLVIWLKPVFFFLSDHELKPVAIDDKDICSITFHSLPFSFLTLQSTIAAQ